MRKSLLLSAALLALLAGPAMAQRSDRGGDRGDRGERGGGRPTAAAPAQAAPAQAAPAPAPQAAPAPANRAEAGRQSMQREQAQRQQFQNRDRNNFAQRNDNNTRPDFNRGGNNNRSDFNRGNENRGNNFGRNDNRNASQQNWSRYNRAFNSSRQFRYRGGSYVRPSGWYNRRWSFGEYLPSLFWGSNYWINDFYYYDLPPPPVGAVWVRYGTDALLIDRYSGEIIEVEYGIFY